MPVAVGCLVGRHQWEPVREMDTLRLDPQQCRNCGRTRIWNARDHAWMIGPAEGLPEDLVDYLAGSEAAGEAALSPDFDIPIADELRYGSGGGAMVQAGILVAAMSLPLWLAAPPWAPKLALGVPLAALGWVIAGGRREVRVDRRARTLVHRVRLWPLTVFDRTLRASQLDRIRVAREPNAPVFGPRWGRKPHFLVRALGPGVDLRIAAFYEPKGARSAGRSIGRALEVTLDDKTREPGAPGT